MGLASIAAGLRRITTSGTFVPEIDGLRFVAVMAVLLYHLDGYVAAKATAPASGSWIHAVLGTGFIGVQVFFAISGLVLMLPQAARHLRGEAWPGLRAYYLRRLTRLEPPYILCLTVLALLLMIVRHEALATLLPHWLASVLYVHAPIYGRGSTILPAAWSLEIEVQFYLLAPLLANVFRIRPAWLRRTVLVAAAVPPALVATLRPHHLPAHGLTLAHQLHWFLMGFLVADLLVSEWRTLPPRAWFFDIAGLGSWVALPLLATSGPWLEWLGAPAILLALVAAFRGRAHGWLLRLEPVVLIGGACYTIYLWHETLISALGRLSLKAAVFPSHAANLVTQGLILVPAVLCVSLVLYALFERPFMRRDWPARVRDFVARRRQP